MHSFKISLCSLFWGCEGFGTFWDLWRYLSIVAAVWQIENPIFECVTSHVLGQGGELHRSLRNCPPLINTPSSVVSDNVEDPARQRWREKSRKNVVVVRYWWLWKESWADSECRRTRRSGVEKVSKPPARRRQPASFQLFSDLNLLDTRCNMFSAL